MIIFFVEKERYLLKSYQKVQLKGDERLRTLELLVSVVVQQLADGGVE